MMTDPRAMREGKKVPIWIDLETMTISVQGAFMFYMNSVVKRNKIPWYHLVGV